MRRNTFHHSGHESQEKKQVGLAPWTRSMLVGVLNLSALGGAGLTTSACDEEPAEVKSKAPVASIRPASKAAPAPLPKASMKKPKPVGPIDYPLICVNGSLETGKRNDIQFRIRGGLTQANAEILRVNPENFNAVREYCNGIFAVGGPDIDTGKIPQSAPVHPKAKLMSAERQDFDKRFISWARSNKVPVFGECLGFQEMAVYEGEGAQLIQHIPDEPKSLNHYGFHTVSLDEQAAVFGLGSSTTVKSNHHQAPREPLAPTLEVVGRSSDGLVEAAISTDGLAWGIQWHPKPGKQSVIYNKYVEMVKERAYRSDKVTEPWTKSKAHQEFALSQLISGRPSDIGPTLMTGDSLSVHLGSYQGKLDMMGAKIVAKGGQRSPWVLARVQELAKAGGLGQFENAVVLIGTNDVAYESNVQASINRIEKIYQTLLGDTDYDGKPDTPGVGRLYGVTVPPFKGKNSYCNYRKRKTDVEAEADSCPDMKKFNMINDRRLALNAAIKKSRYPYRVLDLAAPRSRGGFADDNDVDRLTVIGPSGNEITQYDDMHFPTGWLRHFYETELARDAR